MGTLLPKLKFFHKASERGGGGWDCLAGEKTKLAGAGSDLCTRKGKLVAVLAGRSGLSVWFDLGMVT